MRDVRPVLQIQGQAKVLVSEDYDIMYTISLIDVIIIALSLMNSQKLTTDHYHNQYH